MPKYKYEILPYDPNENCEEVIAFCNEHGDKGSLVMGYTGFQMDVNEWVYVLGESFINGIKSALE